MNYESIDDNSRYVVARKNHKCEWCGESINKGQECAVRVYKLDGNLINARQHPECMSAMFASDIDLDEGFDTGANPRGKAINIYGEPL